MTYWTTSMDFFSNTLKKVWNVWEIRAMIITSLCTQIILIFFGYKRKTNGGMLIRVLAWSAYLAANWVATVCLSALATNDNYSTKATSSVQSFWAPFLLLHLGGRLLLWRQWALVKTFSSPPCPSRSRNLRPVKVLEYG